MVYVYECGICGRATEVTKSVKFIDEPEFCEDCNAEMKRVVQSPFFRCYDHHKGEWNPGLGAYITSDRQKKELMKRRNLVEVGNEDPVKESAHMRKQKQEQEDREWERL